MFNVKVKRYPSDSLKIKNFTEQPDVRFESNYHHALFRNRSYKTILMIVYNGVDHGVVTAILQRVIHERFRHRDLRIGWNRVLPVWSKENSLPPWTLLMHGEDLEEEYRLLRQAREEMYAEHLALMEQIAKETQRLKEENEELVRGIKLMEDSEQCN
jgi:hypothetical protein